VALAFHISRFSFCSWSKSSPHLASIIFGNLNLLSIQCQVFALNFWRTWVGSDSDSLPPKSPHFPASFSHSNTCPGLALPYPAFCGGAWNGASSWQRIGNGTGLGFSDAAQFVVAPAFLCGRVVGFHRPLNFKVNFRSSTCPIFLGLCGRHIVLTAALCNPLLGSSSNNAYCFSCFPAPFECF